MEKAWFMASMEYIPNGKGIIVPIEYTLTVIVPMEKAWFYEKLFSEVVMVMVKDKKIHHKRYNFNQNKFYAFHEVDKSNVTNGFQRIGSGLYFFAPFSFSLPLSIGK